MGIVLLPFRLNSLGSVKVSLEMIWARGDSAMALAASSGFSRARAMKSLRWVVSSSTKAFCSSLISASYPPEETTG